MAQHTHGLRTRLEECPMREGRARPRANAQALDEAFTTSEVRESARPRMEAVAQEAQAMRDKVPQPCQHGSARERSHQESLGTSEPSTCVSRTLVFCPVFSLRSYDSVLSQYRVDKCCLMFTSQPFGSGSRATQE